MLLKNLQKGITTEMRGGELRKNQNDIITNLVLATKGDIEIAKELVSFRQFKNTNYFVNGLGEVLEKVADKFYFVAQNEKERESYLRIKFDKSIKIDNEYKKQVNTHIAVANCFLKNMNSRQPNKCLYLNLDKEFDKRVQELKEIYNISFAA